MGLAGHLDSRLLALSRSRSPPPAETYLELLRVCCRSKSLQHLKTLQAHIDLHKPHLMTSATAYAFLSDYLVMALAKCGAPDDARHLSATLLPNLTIFSWTAIIAAYADSCRPQEAFDVYNQMRNNGVEADAFTFVSLFKSCGTLSDLKLGMELHCDARAKGFTCNEFVGNAMISMYVECAALDHARDALNDLPCSNTMSWNILLSAVVDQGQDHRALGLLQDMLHCGVEPDSFTFVWLFKACSLSSNLKEGKKMHTQAGCRNLLQNPFVGNSILTMYRKCGTVEEAEDLFVLLPYRDMVSWNGMLSVYVEQEELVKSLILFRQMKEEGIEIDQATYVTVFHACTALTVNENAFRAGIIAVKDMWKQIGTALHADAYRKKFDSDVMVGTAILNMYGKLGMIKHAEHVFRSLGNVDTVAWNAILSMYVANGFAEMAFLVYVEMQKQDISPNHITFVAMLQACSALAAQELNLNGKSLLEICVELGKAMHADINRNGCGTYGPICNTLVNMYGKCGAIKEAEEVFIMSSHSDVVSWNAILSAYVEIGQETKALSLYTTMRKDSIIVDDVTHLCLLQACSAAGNLEICKEIHFGVVSVEHDILPSVATTLIDAYGRCADLEDAHVTFYNIREPNVVSWNALISGYAGEGNSLPTLSVLENMKFIGLKPNNVTLTSILSVCSHSGLVVTGLECLVSMVRIYNISLERIHYKVIIDLLGRAEDFKRVQDIMGRIPLQNDLPIWMCLLDTCSTHGHSVLAMRALNKVIFLMHGMAES